MRYNFVCVHDFCLQYSIIGGIVRSWCVFLFCVWIRACHTRWERCVNIEVKFIQLRIGVWHNFKYYVEHEELLLWRLFFLFVRLLAILIYSFHFLQKWVRKKFDFPFRNGFARVGRKMLRMNHAGVHMYLSDLREIFMIHYRDSLQYWVLGTETEAVD